ncbi:MAG: 3-hydroxyacyl-CoA dehydrogenase family protein [Bdellovibrionota bacterium]|nr:3-hydroxyacyl-CoA dehydrogenase family protein [Bdellovibrionota bacterium]
MNNIAFFISENHPYLSVIKNSSYPVIVIDPVAIDEVDYSELDDIDTVIDFTCFPRETKIELVLKLADVFRGQLFCDLTVNWAEFFLDEFENIDGAIATAFYSPNDTFECFVKNKDNLELIEKVFNNLNFKTQVIENPGICFNYPRIISNIINEAYFAKEEKLATDEDIDKAMRYGVNYPLGPFEWSKKIGLDKVALVLLELYEATGDARYRMSRYIKRELI